MRLFCYTVLGLFLVFLFGSSFTYEIAGPGRKLSFPLDHYSHPNFKTEWWYYTGHLTSEKGREFGFQVTFFRYGLRDRQEDEIQGVPIFTDLYMAHFTLLDKQGKKLFFQERANRGHNGKAGALTDRYYVWNEDWKVEARGEIHVVEIKHQDKALRLQLTPLKPPIRHGRDGLSQKGEGRGKSSHYYSFTRLMTKGVVEINGIKEKVEGLSWMDHEFGSNQLEERQVGWDWFSIQLDNKTEIMLYLIRRKNGSVDSHSSGTLVYEDGTARHLALQDFKVEVLKKWKSPKSGGHYPIKWKINIPSENIHLKIVPFFPRQELDSRRSTRVIYWEGAVRVQGLFQGKPLQGSGFVEMTGYVGNLKL